MRLNFRLLITVFICIAVPIISLSLPPANNQLKGKITDDDHGEPIIGATITIPDLKAGAVSDSVGNYLIKNLPKGRYLVEVRSLGFNTMTKYIAIDQVTDQNFQLHESIIEKNEVIITGTSMATEERKSVIPIQSIRMKELRENPSTNIIDAISKMPGVSQVTTGPAISKPVIRGLSYNRIITLNDGVKQEGQQWGDEHGIEIDDYNVSRIEVLKGPASFAYGSDAIAGVINIISDEPLPLGRIEANVAANYQSNNGLFAEHASLAGNLNGFTWDTYITNKQAHDYQNKYDGYVFNSSFNNINYGATIGFNKKWGYSRLAFTSFNQNLGIVEGDRDSATGKFIKLVNDNGEEKEEIATNEDGRSYSKQIPAQGIEHQKIVWTNNIYLHNAGRIGLTLGYQQNTRKEFGDVLEPDKPGLHFLLQTYNYDLKYFFPEWQGWQASAGVNGMQQKNTNKGIEFLIPDYTLFDAGVYLIAKKDWDKWAISGGLRLNHRTINGENLFLDSMDERVNGPVPGGIIQFQSFNSNYSNLVGSVGISYDLTERMTLKFNVATGFRAPNIAELSANGVHEGTIRYEYGNSKLLPEKSIQGDAGLGWNSNHVLVNASLFYNYIKDYIYISKLQSVNGGDSIPELHNADGFPAFVYTQTNAALYGGEFFIDLHPHPLDWLHFENTFSYVRGITFNSTGSTRNLPYMPPARWLIELRAQKKSTGKWARNFYAKAGVDMNFAQNNVFSAYGTETATPGYTLVNAGLGLDIVNKKQATVCSVNLSVNNITDVAYQNHLSRLKYADVNNVTGRGGVFGMGRNFSVNLNVPLVLKKQE
jgi:iron complex outermembrane receptor protein